MQKLAFPGSDDVEGRGLPQCSMPRRQLFCSAMPPCSSPAGHLLLLANCTWRVADASAVNLEGKAVLQVHHSGAWPARMARQPMRTRRCSPLRRDNDPAPPQSNLPATWCLRIHRHGVCAAMMTRRMDSIFAGTMAALPPNTSSATGNSKLAVRHGAATKRRPRTLMLVKLERRPR
jgi:hypothetical protein